MVVIVRWLIQADKLKCVSDSINRQVLFIERWLLLVDKYDCVSCSMIDRWLLLYGGCCTQVSTVVSLVVW